MVTSRIGKAVGGGDRADLADHRREAGAHAAYFSREHLAREQVGLRVGADIGHEVEQHHAGHDEVQPGRAVRVEGQGRNAQPDRAAEETEDLQLDASQAIRQRDGKDDADDEQRRCERRGLGRMDTARNQVGGAADLVRSAAKRGGDQGRGEDADAVSAEILEQPRRRREDGGAEIFRIEKREEALFRRALFIDDMAYQLHFLRIGRLTVRAGVSRLFRRVHAHRARSASWRFPG